MDIHELRGLPGHTLPKLKLPKIEFPKYLSGILVVTRVESTFYQVVAVSLDEFNSEKSRRNCIKNPHAITVKR